MKALILLFSTIILSTCSNSNKIVDITTLFGKELKVISIDQKDITNLNLTMSFEAENNSINGFAGCNRFFGNYVLEKNKINFSKIGATKMYCKNDVINENETIFLKFLSMVKFYKTTKNDTIQLLDENNNPLITLLI